MRKSCRWGILAVLMGLLAACGAHKSGAPDAKAKAGEVSRAIARIEAKSGSTVRGTASFARAGKGVKLEVKLEGAEPGMHAVHIHEQGDCSAADGTSAGDHWNPTHQQHGEWGHDGFHLGDIGNVTVAADGRGQLTLETDRWSMGTGAANDILKRAVIVHAKPDDFTTQPTGAAGGRIGCGVIEAN